MLAPSRYVIQIDRDKCESCGNCVDSCQFKALRLDNGRLVVEEELCMRCGARIPRCEKGAHSLVLDERKGVLLEIQKLIERAVVG